MKKYIGFFNQWGKMGFRYGFFTGGYGWLRITGFYGLKTPISYLERFFADVEPT